MMMLMTMMGKGEADDVTALPSQPCKDDSMSYYTAPSPPPPPACPCPPPRPAKPHPASPAASPHWEVLEG